MYNIQFYIITNNYIFCVILYREYFHAPLTVPFLSDVVGVRSSIHHLEKRPFHNPSNSTPCRQHMQDSTGQASGNSAWSISDTRPRVFRSSGRSPECLLSCRKVPDEHRTHSFCPPTMDSPDDPCSTPNNCGYRHRAYRSLYLVTEPGACMLLPFHTGCLCRNEGLESLLIL